MGKKKRNPRHSGRKMTRSRRRKSKRNAQHAIKKDNFVTKEKSGHEWAKVALTIFAATLIVFSGILLYSNSSFVPDKENVETPEQTSPPDVTVRRAAIVDGLYSTKPNLTLTQNLINILEEAGLRVDVFQGESVTIDLLRNIGGYEIVILRLHSCIHTDGFLYLFSGEPYTESKYTAEQLQGAVRRGYTYSGDEGPFFALNAVFLGINNPLGLEGSTIIMMGCNGTGDSYSIQKFLEREVKAYVAWNGSVDLSYSDGATLLLVKTLSSDGATLKEAVKKVMKDIGPDPFYGSTLECFQPQ